MKKFLLGGIVALLLVFLLSGIVLAIDNPDSVSIGDVYVFRDLVETGDQLYFCRYDVYYSPIPPEDASDTWQMVVCNSSGVLAGTRPLNYYLENIISVYFSASQVSTWNLTWQAANLIKIQGMPSIFSPLVEGVNMKTATLSPSDYYGKSYLGGIMIAQARILEVSWNTTLVSAYDKLNYSGSYVFRKAIPQLGTIAPEIFEVVVSSIDITYEEYPDTYPESLKPSAGDQLTDAMAELSNMLNIENSEWVAFLCVILLSLMLMGLIAPQMGGVGITLAIGYAALVVCAYIFGGSLFTLVVVMAFTIMVVFGIYFVFSHVNV